MSSSLDLQVHLRTPENVLFEGRCTNLDSGLEEIVALVEFASTQAPAIQLGRKVQLFWGGPASSIETEALPLLRTDDGARRCYSFRLSNVSKKLLLLFGDRRGSTRVRPQASRPVRVTILDITDEVPLEAIVHDISGIGLSILVEPALEERLINRQQLRLSLRLPGDEEAIEMITTIRHRRLFGSGILYGLEIDGRIPDFMRAQERILLYVANLRNQEAFRP